MRVIAEPLAQSAHQKIDRAIEDVELAALRQVQELLTAQDPLRVIEEDAQQPILGAAQRHHRARGVEEVTRHRLKLKPAGE